LASRLGKPGQPGGTSTGVGADGRSAARHVSPLPQGRGRDTKKKRKEVEASVPARAEESRVWLLARRLNVAEVGRRRLVSNKLGKRVPKRTAGSSEQRPSSERGSAGETVGKRVERRARRESTSPLKTGEDRPRLRVKRDLHPAVTTSPKAVRWSRDRGSKGHRILRRVPTDGRHSRSSRGVGFHETASTVVSAVSASSDPHQLFQKKNVWPGCSSRETARGVGMNQEIATGVSEARSQQRRGKKTPTLVTQKKHES
jgi:hypothetical protein